MLFVRTGSGGSPVEVEPTVRIFRLFDDWYPRKLDPSRPIVQTEDDSIAPPHQIRLVKSRVGTLVHLCVSVMFQPNVPMRAAILGAK